MHSEKTPGRIVAFILLIIICVSIPTEYAVCDDYDIYAASYKTYDTTYEDILKMYLKVMPAQCREQSRRRHDLYNDFMYADLSSYYMEDLMTPEYEKMNDAQKKAKRKELQEKTLQYMKKTVGYAIQDINGDGIDELIIGRNNSYIYELFTKGYERENHFEFSIASHPMGDYLLLSIIIRGTGLWGDDVGTDLNVEGFEIMGVQFHTGFMEFMWEILTGLQKYVDERPYFAQKLEEGKVKMLVTGHSLGAAAANLIGAYMMSDEYGGPKVPQDDLYVYCYATPRTFIRNWVNKAKTSDCFNIINVVINSDPVPAAPDDPRGEIWYRFGQTRFYINPFGVRKDHDTASYIEVVFNRKCEAQLRERWKDVIISK